MNSAPVLKSGWVELGAGRGRYICVVRDCASSVYSWGETDEGVWRQHGDNPEHRRFLGTHESGYAWLLEVHRYEEARI